MMKVGVSSCVALVLLLYGALDISFGGSGLSELCSRCPGVVRNGSRVMTECVSGEVVERCCVMRECGNCSADVIGLDWSHCNLTKLTDYIFSEVGTSLETLDLSGNDDLTNETISTRALGGLTNLTTLVLPSGLGCGPSAWGRNETDQNYTVCEEPVWPCDWAVIEPPGSGYNLSDKVNWFNLTDSNFTEICPPNSHCVPDGPGLHQCLCSNGYHGYKCLLQGNFPYVTFFASSVSGAVVVIAIYWGLRMTEKLFRTRASFTLTS